jgi:hypothetical protein
MQGYSRAPQAQLLPYRWHWIVYNSNLSSEKLLGIHLFSFVQKITQRQFGGTIQNADDFKTVSFLHFHSLIFTLLVWKMDGSSLVGFDMYACLIRSVHKGEESAEPDSLYQILHCCQARQFAGFHWEIFPFQKYLNQSKRPGLKSQIRKPQS